MDVVSMVLFYGKFFMIFGNGKEMEVDYINFVKGCLFYKFSMFIIFLKVMDGLNFMLLIVVGEVVVNMFMRVLYDDEYVGWLNYYVLMCDMVEILYYELWMVRIIDRVVDMYYVRIYVGKFGEEEFVSVDVRLLDVINFVVCCKILIYVNSSIIKVDVVCFVMEVEFIRRVEFSFFRKRSIFFGEFFLYELDVF